MRVSGVTHSAGRRWRCWLAAGLLLLAMPVAGWLALRWVPLPADLVEPPRGAMELTDRHGVPLRAMPSADEFRRVAAYAEFPPALIAATLAAEDSRFWEHPGVDWRAMLRAAYQGVRHRRVVSGASTITQQLVKLADPRPRTLRSKLIEAARALRLEQLWDKQRILAAYLNRLNYGNLCTGTAEAAAFHFRKPLGDLSPAEAAFLAGIPQAPTRLNPHRFFNRAKQRQEWILGRMLATGRMTTAEFQRALAEPIRLQPARRVFRAPHFADLVVRREAKRLEESNGPVRTSLDLELNRFAEETLRTHLGRLREYGARNGAVVILDNATGDVLALVGSEDYFSPFAGQVNGAWARRSPGSALKPFTYLLAFARGQSPATVVPDVPTEFPTPTGIFRPVNYDRRYLGPVRLREALGNSLNIPAVRVLASVGGPPTLHTLLRDCGLTTLDQPADHYGLGLTLGNAEVRLLELVNAYAALARLGEFRPFRFFPQRNAGEPEARRIAPPAAAWLVADVLSDNEARRRAFGDDSPLRFDFPVACKTGTSTDYRDNWALGYTPEFTVGVWVGNFEGARMDRLAGAVGAAPILNSLVQHLHAQRGSSAFVRPEGVAEDWVDPLTGKRCSSDQPGAVRERFLADAPPPPADESDYDPHGRVRLGPEYGEWFASGDNALGDRATLDSRLERAALRLLSPLPGARYFLDADLPNEGAWLPLRASGSDGLQWWSPTLEIVGSNGTFRAHLVEGRHQIAVQAAGMGQWATAIIEVNRR